MRRFEDAIKLIDTYRGNINTSSLPSTINSVFIEQAMDKLANVISQDMQNLSVIKGLKNVIGWLVKLNRLDQARELFFLHQSRQIKSEKYQLKFEGDIVKYFKKYSDIAFSNIQKASDEYMAIFSEKDIFSDFLVWAFSELLQFNSDFNHQVLTCGSLRAISECLTEVLAHCDRLEKGGLSFSFFLKRKFISEIKKTIGDWHVEESFYTLINEEAKQGWLSHTLPLKLLFNTEGNDNVNKLNVRLLKSGRYFFTVMCDYIAEALSVKAYELQVEFLNWIIRLFRSYFARLFLKAEEGFVYNDDDKFLSVYSTIFYIIEYLLNPFRKDGKINNAEIDKIAEALQVNAATMLDRYCLTRAITLLDVLAISTIDYSSNTDVSSSSASTFTTSGRNVSSSTYSSSPPFSRATSTTSSAAVPFASVSSSSSPITLMQPSEPFRAFAVQLGSITLAARLHFPNRPAAPFIMCILVHVFDLLTRVNFVKAPADFERKSPLLIGKVGRQGIHQLLLDIAYMESSIRLFLHDPIPELIRRLRGRIVEVYESTYPDDARGQWLKEPSVYKECADNAFFMSLSAGRPEDQESKVMDALLCETNTADKK